MAKRNPDHNYCDTCGRDMGYLAAEVCHECEQAEIDATRCGICGEDQGACRCDGGPFIPGGYRL